MQRGEAKWKRENKIWPGQVKIVASTAKHVEGLVTRRCGGWLVRYIASFLSPHVYRGTLAMGTIPNYRGRGIGYRLVVAVLEQARKVDLVRVEASV
ncbi:hypothetical protein IL59_0209545 [Brucella suis bv. 4 str. 40]|nr:hypothetical protein IL59_0209545 [Brucella suis bv. 4 str. 40]